MICRIKRVQKEDESGVWVERYGIRITEGDAVLFEEEDLCGDCEALNRFCTDINLLQPEVIHLPEIIEDFVQECAFG